MPLLIKYGTLEFTGKDLGYLGFEEKIGIRFDYSVFVGIPFKAPRLTNKARAYILGAGGSPSDFKGDGIVPEGNQTMTDLPRFPSGAITFGNLIGDDFLEPSLYHTEETGRDTDITAQVNKLVPWWKN